jgi:hypothetical protein
MDDYRGIPEGSTDVMSGCGCLLQVWALSVGAVISLVGLGVPFLAAILAVIPAVVMTRKAIAGLPRTQENRRSKRPPSHDK